MKVFFMFVFFILLFSCSQQKKIKSSRIEVHGHRGARSVMPENSLQAFDYALKQGVDVLELDLTITRDEKVIISHDPIVNDKMCTIPVKMKKRGKIIPFFTLTLKEVKEIRCGNKVNPRFPRQKLFTDLKIPTLDDLFDLVKKSRHLAAKTVQFNIETKVFPYYPEITPTHEHFVDLILKVFRKHNMMDRIILQSFDYRTLKYARKKGPKLRTALLTYKNYFPFAAALTAIEADYLSPHHEWIDKEAVDELHAQGFKVVPWTVNDKKDWQRLIDMGVDGIISDDPEALIKFLKKD